MRSFDLKGSLRSAFSHGLWRGLGAPAMIYAAHELPEELEPKFVPVENPAERTSGITGDWRRVGQHLRSASKNDK